MVLVESRENQLDRQVGVNLVDKMHRQLPVDYQRVFARHNVHQPEAWGHHAAVGENVHGHHGAVYRRLDHDIAQVVVKAVQAVGQTLGFFLDV